MRARELLTLLTVGTGAFLLFGVQPLITKWLLPWFGGVPAVWTAAMLFFQLVLLAGYGLAHAISGCSGGTQRIVTAALALLVVAALVAGGLGWPSPITPDASWKPAPGATPQLALVLRLALAVGAPALLLAAGGPLLQRWAAESAGADAYRLYAVSNAGSLLALLAYPLLAEPALTTRAQGWTWAGLLAAYLVGLLLCSRQAASPPEPDEADAPAPIAWRSWLGWLALAAAPVVLLLAISHQLSEDVAVVPLLWVAPLAAYLLGWIVAFARDVKGPRGLLPAYVGLALLALMLMRARVADHSEGTAGFILVSSIYCLALFALSTYCHSELARSKPDARRLTSFYLAISLGGSIGGVLAAIVAPLLLPTTWELELSLFACVLLPVIAHARDPEGAFFKGHRHAAPGTLITLLPAAALLFENRWSRPLELTEDTVNVVHMICLLAVLPILALLTRLPPTSRWYPSKPRWVWLQAAAAMLVLTLGLLHQGGRHLINIEHIERSFFGVLRITSRDVYQQTDSARLTYRVRAMSHGKIKHGSQVIDPAALASEPTTYYTRQGGLGVAISSHPRREAGEALRVGMVGLGVGTVAALTRKGDQLVIYEIDPRVAALASREAGWFSFLARCPAELEVITGDARLALEREAPRRFDVLAIDAFTGGSVPVHLLTVEAFRSYQRHLREGGVIVVHTSNHFLDLSPVVYGAADAVGMHPALLQHAPPDDGPPWRSSSEWILLCADAARLGDPAVKALRLVGPASRRPWTDQKSDLLSLLRLGKE